MAGVGEDHVQVRVTDGDLVEQPRTRELQPRGPVERRPRVKHNRQPTLAAIAIDRIQPHVVRVKPGIDRTHLDAAQPGLSYTVAQLLEVAGLRGIARGKPDKLVRRPRDEPSDVVIRHPVAGQTRLQAEDQHFVEGRHVRHELLVVDGKVQGVAAG